MPRLPRPIKLFVLAALFFISLALSLWMGKLVLAQENGDNQRDSAPAQVQQGIEQYQMGNFQGAIALWQAALEQYQASQNLPNQAIVLENLARTYQRMGDTEDALLYWQQVLAVQQQLGDRPKVGQLLTEQAQTYVVLGQYTQAVDLLCGAGIGSGVIESEEVSNGRDQNGEGRGDELVTRCRTGSAVEIAVTAGDRVGEAAAFGSLGEVLRLQGRYSQAEAALVQSLAIATELDNQAYQTAAHKGLGNIYRQQARISDRRADDAILRNDSEDAKILRQEALTKNAQALTYFETSLALATRTGDQQTRMQVLTSLISVYHRAGNVTATRQTYGEAIALFDQLPDSRLKAYAVIDLANLYPLVQANANVPGKLSGATCDGVVRDNADVNQVADLLRQAIATAQAIEDYRAQSFAFGKLGYIEECRGNYDQALQFTQNAAWAADQSLTSPDSLYLWQWQTGRILKQQGKADAAIAAYEEAVTTLEKIRGDILITDRDIQFDFRDTVEPIYRQLAELRLAQAPTSSRILPEDQAISSNVRSALAAIDSLKLAELQNYFGDECLVLEAIAPEEATRTIATRDPRTGIFSTFILADRTAIILTLPDGSKRVEWLELDRDSLNQVVNAFRIQLETSRYDLQGYDPSMGQPLYDQLIRPFASDLAQAGVDTLVFVQDGIFRSVPMAALYDGRQYLIEQYALATTPSLSLTPLAPTRMPGSPRVLALGLTNAITTPDEQQWAALPGVQLEVNRITQQLPGSQKLLNGDFTRDRLRTELRDNEYSIVHMATHGEFGAEPQDTFLVTGDGQKLTIGELEAAIRQAGGTTQIDLLTLTACQTAIGDNRSALGLAGVAVQAGARSAIASLWAINDASTAEITAQFYRQLSDPAITKAQALQQAQQSFISQGGKLARPGLWAPFILIGDWR